MTEITIVVFSGRNFYSDPYFSRGGKVICKMRKLVKLGIGISALSLIVVLSMSAHLYAENVFSGGYKGPPLVTNEEGALRIARAMLIAKTPEGRWTEAEDAWIKKCSAHLSSDGEVWYVRNKGSAGVAGPCTGNLVVGIGARDGRWMGASVF